MSGGTLSSLIGFWNQQNSEPIQPPKREPSIGRVKRWEIPSPCNQIRKGDVSPSTIHSPRKWEPGSSNKREVPTVICTPPVNKWEGSGGFVLGLEGFRGSDGSERSDGSDNKEVGKDDHEDGEALMGKLGTSTYSTTSAPQTPVTGHKSPLLGYQSPSTPNSPGGAPTTSSPFSKFRQLDKQASESNSESLVPKTGAVLYRNSSMPASPRPKSLVSPAPVARSGSNAKEVILTWVQSRLKDYPIPISNFSVCWNDGLAFCALIHVFYPDNFDWYALKSENRRYNFTLGFDKAEELADIYPLLEVDDMVKYQKPDWKCVFTYVQSFYRRFRDAKAPTPNIIQNKESKDKVDVKEEDMSSSPERR